MALIRFGRIVDTWDTVDYHADGFLAEPNSSRIPAIFNVRPLFGSQFFFIKCSFNFSKYFPEPEYTYYILGTDYFQYSLVWFCYDIGENLSEEYSVVWSRTTDLPPLQRQRVDELIGQHLNNDFMRPTEHADEVCINWKKQGIELL